MPSHKLGVCDKSTTFLLCDSLTADTYTTWSDKLWLLCSLKHFKYEYGMAPNEIRLFNSRPKKKLPRVDVIAFEIPLLQVLFNGPVSTSLLDSDEHLQSRIPLQEQWQCGQERLKDFRIEEEVGSDDKVQVGQLCQRCLGMLAPTQADDGHLFVRKSVDFDGFLAILQRVWLPIVVGQINLGRAKLRTEQARQCGTRP